MKNIFIVIQLFIMTFLIAYHFSTEHENDQILTRLAERAYVQGQKEALTDDVRIKFNDKTKEWEWAKSPWNDGRKPYYAKPTGTE